MLPRRILLTLLACSYLLAGTPCAAGAPATPQRSVSAFYVTIIDHSANGKRSRVRIDVRTPQPPQAPPRGPLVSTPGGLDYCSALLAFNISTGFALSCQSEAPGSPSKANAWGDCEVNDEKHPVGFQFIPVRQGGPNWELWAWCVME